MFSRLTKINISRILFGRNQEYRFPTDSSSYLIKEELKKVKEETEKRVIIIGLNNFVPEEFYCRQIKK